MDDEVVVSDFTAILLRDLEQNINVILEKDKERIDWNKDLIGMPVFTIKEIEEHRIKSGKGAAIVKTLDRGRKFREERFIYIS